MAGNSDLGFLGGIFSPKGGEVLRGNTGSESNTSATLCEGIFLDAH